MDDESPREGVGSPGFISVGASQRRKLVVALAVASAGVILGVLAAAVLEPLLPDRFDQPTMSVADKLTGLVGLPLALLTVIVVHEAGHVVGGLAAGFRFVLLIAGPLKVTAGTRGPRIGLNRSLALAGGLAACVPLDGRALRGGLMRMVAGGPAASLLLSVVCGVGWSVFRETPPWNFLLLVTAAVSLAIGVGTLIPLRVSGFHSDGAQLLSLFSGDDLVVQEKAAIGGVLGLSLAGVRPRDWPSSDVARLPTRSADPNVTLAARLMTAYRAIDSGDDAEAERLLSPTAVTADAAPVLRAAAGLELAWIAATVRGDAANARRLRQAGDDTLVEFHSKLRVDAAIALAEADRTAAAVLAAESIWRSHRALDAGLATAEREWIDLRILGRHAAGP